MKEKSRTFTAAIRHVPWLCWSGPDYHIKQDRSKCSFSHRYSWKVVHEKNSLLHLSSLSVCTSVPLHICALAASRLPQLLLTGNWALVPKSKACYHCGYLSLISLLWWSTPATDIFYPVSGMVSDPSWQRIVHSVHMFCVNNTRTPQTVFRKIHLWGRCVLIKGKPK